MVELEELGKLIDKIGALAFNTSQNKVFTLLLTEHVFHAYQQLHTDQMQEKMNDAMLQATFDAAQLLDKILSDDPHNAREKDKQNEYLFERESAETVELITSQLEKLSASIPENVIRHPRQGYESKSGIMSSAETCGPKASTVFHLLNEPDLLLLEQETEMNRANTMTNNDTGAMSVSLSTSSSLVSERRRLLKMACQQLEETPASTNSQVRTIIISGSVGVGKSHFALHFARTIEDRFKGDQSFQKFHLRLKSNTEFPMTSLEAKQSIIKMWHVGSLPVRDQREIDDLYNKTFFGKTSILLLEDLSSLRQLMELTPNVRQSVRSSVYIIVETRSSSLTQSQTNLDKILKYTTGQVDFLDGTGFANKKAESTDEKPVVYNDEDDLDDDDDDDLDDELDDEEDEEEDENKNRQTRILNQQMRKIFGKTKRKTVSVTLLDEEDEELDDDAAIEKMISRMKHFYVLFINLQKLSLEGSTELVLMGNKRTVAESVRTLGVLLENVPIFLKIVGRTHFLYLSSDRHEEKWSTSEMVKYIGTQVDEVANRKNYTRIRQLCHGSFIGCFRKWPEHIRKLVLQLSSVFPNSFDPLSASIITGIPLSKLLVYLFELMQVGVLYTQEPMRYALHDLARETYSAHIYERENSEFLQMVDECKQKHLKHYFDLLKRLNYEHEFSGIEYMPGIERYDLELENMKAVMNFMQEKEVDHIEAINRCRYIFRHRVFAMKRGMLYQHLSKFVNDIEDYFVIAEFLEGFAYVYIDLTDYERGFTQANRALEIKQDAVTMSEDSSREVELLSVLKLLGDTNVSLHKFDAAREVYLRMITIAERCARPWQKQKIEQKLAGYEDETEIIVDTFLGHAQKSLAMICLMKSDIEGGRRYFERGIAVMRRVLCSTHPELSESYANYALTLTKFKSKQFYDEICRLYEEAIAIDTALFGDKSTVVGDRNNDYGSALLTMARFQQAEVYFRKALIIRQKNYGTKDMTVAATTNNLAVACKNVGKLDEAEKLYKRSLEITIEILGEKDPLVQIARSNLAQALSSMGKADEAKELYTKSIDELTQNGSENLTQEDALNMATMLQQMGDNARKQENFTDAFKYLDQALSIRKQISTDESKDGEIAKTLSAIAQLYFDQGKFEECEQLLNQSIHVIENVYGKKHPSYISSLTSLANARFKMQKFAEAKDLFIQVLQMQKDSGDTPYQLLSAQQSLAITYDATKKFDEALKLYQEILKTIQSLKPVDKAKEKFVLLSIATNMTKTKNFRGALEVYRKVETIVIEETGDDDLDYANLIYNIGACQLSGEQFDDAEISFAKAYQIFVDRLGDDHEKSIEAFDMLTEIRRIIYERDHSEGCCAKCMIM